MFGEPDNGVEQHALYVKALESTGSQGGREAREEFPDSCFVEDAALCTKYCAVLKRPSAATRQKEVLLEDLQMALEVHRTLGKDFAFDWLYYAVLEGFEEITPDEVSSFEYMEVFHPIWLERLDNLYLTWGVD
ncbi:hypothetical protein CYY_000056 [Polysphondylium violaceum]|uniref:Uncharacterized protein n=1 Tax=Polysphondylium violaceum TaxID=133409 RepID=A0A8J4Q4J6_9MYCE|nr:hypothetical protein CYY_000056 [Polysphondylium violaceum]